MHSAAITVGYLFICTFIAHAAPESFQEASKPDLFLSSIKPSLEEKKDSSHENPDLRIGPHGGVSWVSQYVNVRAEGGFSVTLKGGKLDRRGDITPLYQDSDGILFYCLDTRPVERCTRHPLDLKDEKEKEAIRDIGRALLSRPGLIPHSPQMAGFFRAYFGLAPENGEWKTSSAPNPSSAEAHAGVAGGEHPKAGATNLTPLLKNPENWEARDCSNHGCRYKDRASGKMVLVPKPLEKLKLLVDEPELPAPPTTVAQAAPSSAPHPGETAVPKVNTESYLKELASAEKKIPLLAVVATAPGRCKPCKNLEDILPELAKDVVERAKVLRWDIDENAGQPYFTSSHIPHIFLVDTTSGKIVQSFDAGGASANDLAERIKTAKSNADAPTPN